MDWIESIKTIKKAQENNQLIVFVGAGVSKNSNVPTWWELIKIIADKIGYDRCDFCKKRKEICICEVQLYCMEQLFVNFQYSVVLYYMNIPQWIHLFSLFPVFESYK